VKKSFRYFRDGISLPVALFLFAAVVVNLATANAQEPLQTPNKPVASESVSQRYQIQLKIDFDALSYAGSEQVRWINHGDHATAVLYFHL
jgi:hypothetical protein